MEKVAKRNPLHNLIFTFGSNHEGRHGAGAALHASRFYGAIRGIGEGPMGNCYAIPTKESPYGRVLSLDEIRGGVRRFIAYVRENPDQVFLLTPIGCGLAGHKKRDIAQILKEEGLPENVVLSSSWITN